MAGNENMGGGSGHQDHISVTINYLPARKPLQLEFPADATLNSVKAEAMNKLGVKEETLPDGTQIVFQLFDDDEQLTDLSRTIGDVAAPGRHAKLNLVKQIVQGA